jgi:pimeloyl-ACP methyl ester carboxylesterase
MPVVFVHGVPDTAHVWQALIARLARKDVVTVSLPGFACPLPACFEATKEGYVDWLLRELAALSGPIDLVGHDWGALLVLRSVSLRPDIARTWAAGAAPIDPEYEWHDSAKMWQTPELGEQMMGAMTPDAMAAALAGAGIPEADAAETSRRIDETMKQCILRLYRSAVNVGVEWKDDLSRITAPGLVVWGDRDPFVAPRFGVRLAENTRARLAHYDCGHWWQVERPAEVASELQRLWA